jgi:hypothetical protein
MNPMAMMAMGVFLKNYPGIADLLMKFPNFKPETIQLLIAFGKKMAECPDPEEFLIATLNHALGGKVQVTVVESKPLPKSKR